MRPSSRRSSTGPPHSAQNEAVTARASLELPVLPSSSTITQAGPLVDITMPGIRLRVHPEGSAPRDQGARALVQLAPPAATATAATATISAGFKCCDRRAYPTKAAMAGSRLRSTP